MTYSIVARDPETGQLGVAVQTCYFNVGAVVPWAQPGVGAVATQSFAELSYGPRALDLLRTGSSPEEALQTLVGADEGQARRQVAVIDSAGRVAVHTGSGCVWAAGHTIGEAVSTQANMMASDTVWGAMLGSFESASGPLSERLLAALRAAEAEGGDLRGRQSAALLVVGGSSTAPAWQREIDLRVEDHPDPVGELGRLLALHRAFDHLGRSGDLAGAGDLQAAAAEGRLALEAAPDDPQIAFMTGLMLAGAGEPVDGRALLDRARAANPGWATFLRRFAGAGLFPNDPRLIDALMPPNEGESV